MMKMNRTIVAALLAAAVSSASLPLAADTATVDGITWTYTLIDGEASLGGGGGIYAVSTSTTGDLTIPSMLDGYPVARIGSSAFNSCGLTSVTIPDSVMSIGDYAFAIVVLRA